MRWKFWKRPRHRALPITKSPFDAETIKPGDEGWKIFEEMMRTGDAVVGTYDPETGKIISMRSVGEGEERGS